MSASYITNMSSQNRLERSWFNYFEKEKCTSLADLFLQFGPLLFQLHQEEWQGVLKHNRNRIIAIYELTLV